MRIGVERHKTGRGSVEEGGAFNCGLNRLWGLGVLCTSTLCKRGGVNRMWALSPAVELSNSLQAQDPCKPSSAVTCCSGHSTWLPFIQEPSTHTRADIRISFAQRVARPDWKCIYGMCASFFFILLVVNGERLNTDESRPRRLTLNVVV